MGWNSWDAYGLTINEADFKANTAELAKFKQYGWQYSVIDEGWYMENPDGQHLADKKYLLNENGILIPVPSRFPTSVEGAGFKPLADWVHQQGLKFGIHIVRGIPKQAVDRNLPYESGVAGQPFPPGGFPIEFYRMAVFFVVFDVEAVFIFAWAVSVREAGWAGFAEMMIFIGVLVAALVYLWRLGALDWRAGSRKGRA